jgi:hypothetical protein
LSFSSIKLPHLLLAGSHGWVLLLAVMGSSIVFTQLNMLVLHTVLNIHVLFQYACLNVPEESAINTVSLTKLMPTQPPLGLQMPKIAGGCF